MNNNLPPLKLMGKTCLQLTRGVTKSDIPTLTLEMDKMENDWKKKLVFQLDPIRELPDFCRFLLGNSGQQITISRKMKDSKSLTGKHQESGLFIGIYHNISEGNDQSYSKILGENQSFALRTVALSRLASVHDVTVRDIVEQLNIHIKTPTTAGL